MFMLVLYLRKVKPKMVVIIREIGERLVGKIRVTFTRSQLTFFLHPTETFVNLPLYGRLFLNISTT